MSDNCPNCHEPIPLDATACPHCSQPLVVARDRAVAAGGDITGIVITGDVAGGVHIEYTPPPKISRPPEPNRPPEMAEFVGREDELAYYAEKLKISHLAVITGMPGVGKTALAAMLARRVSEADEIFWHAFHESEGIQTVVWKLAGFLYRHGQEDLWRMLESARLTGGQPPPTETLFDYLLQMVRGRNYLLCFDDFQFVDDDPLLNQLVERLRGALLAGELAIILTSRRMPDFVQMVEFESLAGLSVADTRQLLTMRGLALSDDLVTNLHARSGGNAELLTLAIDALRRTKDPVRLIDHLVETEDIERYLMNEVDERLSEDERALMSAVAVLLGYPGTRDAIEAVLGGGSVQRTLSDLSDRYLLIVSEGERGREYAQHAIVQAFYYDLSGRRRRQEMHRRAGKYYETEEPDLLKAGLHYERAGEYAQAAQMATADVWTLINQGQARALRGLLRRFEAKQLETEPWVQVNLARGQVYTLLGDGGPARESYEEALSQLATLPDTPTVRELKARVCRGMGELLEQESPHEALNWLERGLAEVAGTSDLDEAGLYIKIGTVQMYLGNYADALSALERGLKCLPEKPHQLLGSALRDIGGIYILQGDMERAKEYTIRALEISRRLHDQFQVVSLLNNLGICEFATRNWQEAIEDWQQALALAERLGSQMQRTSLEGNLGAAYVYIGDDETALKRLSNSLDLAHKNNLHLFESTIQFRLADLRIRRGEWEAAIVPLREAERLALEIDARGSLPEIYGAWAEIMLAMGEHQAALDYAEQAVNLARDLGEGLEQGISQRILGQVLFALGQQQPALAAFEQSLSLLDSQDPYEAARTKLQWGLALLSGIDADRGTGLLEETRSTFQALAAKRDLATLEGILQETGG